MNHRHIRVLCVDGRGGTPSALERNLAPQFECTTAGSAADALAHCASEAFAVVVTEYLLPEMNGVELLRSVRARAPDTVGVLVTEPADLDVAIAAVHDDGVHRYVRKPWTPGALSRAVQDAADYYLLVQNERALREQLARINAELDEKIRDLDEANELLEYWVEFSPAVLYSLSCDGGTLRTSYISKNFSRLTGYERTQAVVDPGFWSGLIPDQHSARYQQTLARLVTGEDSDAVLEYEVRHRAGSRVLVVDSMRAVRDGEGRTVEIVGAWLEVTGRR